MKNLLRATLLCAIYLALLPISSAQTASSHTVWIEFPDMGTSLSHVEESSIAMLPESGAFSRIQSVSIHLSRQPDDLMGASLGIRINTEAGNVVMTQRNTEEGVICDIPLRQNPTVALHPGMMNDIEVFYRDRWNQPHYSVFLLLSPGEVFRPFPPGQDTAIQSNRHYALVIGISRYQQQGPSLPELPYAAGDAKSFRDFLISPEGGSYPADHVKLLLDEDATSENIYHTLSEFAARIGPQDSFVLYLNLHGGYDPMNPGHKYLLTYESNPSSLGGSALPVEELPAWLADHLRTKHIALFSDLCHARKIGEGLSPRSRPHNVINGYLQKLASTHKLASLEAGDKGQLSAGGEQWDNHGVLTYYLLKGLAGAADGATTDGGTGKRDGKVSTYELFFYVAQHVQRATASKQQPLLSFSDGGRFTLTH